MTEQVKGLTDEQYAALQRPFLPTEISWYIRDAKSRNKGFPNLIPDVGWNLFYPFLDRETILKRINEAGAYKRTGQHEEAGALIFSLSFLVQGEWITCSDTGAATTESDKVSNMMKSGSAVTYGLKRAAQAHGIGLEEKSLNPVPIWAEKSGETFIFKIQNPDGSVSEAKSVNELKMLLTGYNQTQYYLERIYLDKKPMFDSSPELLNALNLLKNNI